MLLLGGSEQRRSSGRLPYSLEILQHSFSGAKTCRKYGNGRFKVVTTPVVGRVRFFFCLLGVRSPVLADAHLSPVPKAIGFTVPPLNPALPPRKVAKIPSRFRPPNAAISETVGHGPKRVYLDIQARPPNVAYPPRPVPGGVADLDIIMNFCDFSTGKVLSPPPCSLSPFLNRMSCYSMSVTV